MPRPEKEKKPLLGHAADFTQSVRSADLLKVIYKRALADGEWIYDPSTKRWFNPEEFWEHYQRFDNLDMKWIDELEIRDPEEGLKAADQQIESILSRKAVFVKRIVDYWKNKTKTNH